MKIKYHIHIGAKDKKVGGESTGESTLGTSSKIFERRK